MHAAEDVDGGNPFIHTTRSVNSIQVGLESARNDPSNFTTPATTFRENLYAGEDTDRKGILPPIKSPTHKKSKRQKQLKSILKKSLTKSLSVEMNS